MNPIALFLALVYTFSLAVSAVTVGDDPTPPENTVNVLNKNTTKSNQSDFVQEKVDVDNDASKLYDGVKNGTWEGDDHSFWLTHNNKNENYSDVPDAWATFDLGDLYVLRQGEVFSRADRPNKEEDWTKAIYDIELYASAGGAVDLDDSKNDQGVWTKIGELKNGEEIGASQRFSIEETYASTPYQYLKLHVVRKDQKSYDDGWNHNNICLSEFEVMGYPAPAVSPEPSASPEPSTSPAVSSPKPSSKVIKVTFDGQKGKVDGKTKKIFSYKKNGTLTKLPKASRKDYRFQGWYTKKVGGKKITAKAKVTKSVTYYAQWLKDYALYRTANAPTYADATGNAVFLSKIQNGVTVEESFSSARKIHSYATALKAYGYKSVSIGQVISANQVTQINQSIVDYKNMGMNLRYDCYVKGNNCVITSIASQSGTVVVTLIVGKKTRNLGALL